MTTYAIENADLQQEVSGSLKWKKDKENPVTNADYTQFFSKNPHYAIHTSKEVKKMFGDTVMRFASQDGNSVITVSKNSITAKTQNGEPDIKAMLDLAEAQGWKSIKLPKMRSRGSREFRSALWQEARLRGLEVQGYEPTKLEEQALQAAINKEKETPLQFVPKEQDKPSTEQRLPETAVGSSQNSNEKMLMANSLAIADAHKKIMCVYAEFVPVDSPAYNDIEQCVEQHLSKLYNAGKSVTGNDLHKFNQLKENFAGKMPQARQDFHQAAMIEQHKVQTADKQLQQQQQQTQQPKSERTL